jgi:hypothetical protein
MQGPASAAKLEVVEDRRAQIRDRFVAHDKIKMKSEHFNFDARIMDLTTQGALLFVGDRGKVQVGQDIGAVQITVNDATIATVPRVVVKHTRPVKDGSLVGVGFENIVRTDYKDDQRSLQRASVRQPADAKVVVKHPVNFADDVLFKVEDISIDGMQLSTSLRNRFILPQMMFKGARAFLGQFAEFEFDFEIAYCRIDDAANRLICGIKFEALTSQARHTLAGFLITNHRGAMEHRMAAVRSAGFRIKKLKDIVRFTYASTNQHFLDLQMLRWRAYSSSGKVDCEKTLPENMIDSYDSRSIIILGYIGEDLVGSVRLTECENESQKFEIESEISFRAAIDRTDTIEVSRLCVVPELHGTDVVHGLLEYASKVILQTGKGRVITSCTEDMLPFYLRIGYRRTGETYELQALNNSLHYVISIDPKRGLKGQSVNFVYWAYTYSRVHEYVISRGYAVESTFTALKLRMYKFVAKFALKIMKKQKAA